MTKREWIAVFKRRDACKPAVDWLRSNRGSPQKLWETCTHPSWMSWLIFRAFDDVNRDFDVVRDTVDTIMTLPGRRRANTDYDWAIDRCNIYRTLYPDVTALLNMINTGDPD